jgi:uncharacterized repeat protein (TIGR01451 family)
MKAWNKTQSVVGCSILSVCFLFCRAVATDFASPTSYPVGSNPVAIVVGDFNGDSKPDLAVANSTSANVSVLLGNGDGTFQSAKDSAAGTSPSTPAVADFNGDNKLDLIVTAEDSSGTQTLVNLLLGNGDGTFQTPGKLDASDGAASVVAGDFNGDNKADVIMGDSNGNLIVLLGNGDGTFQSASTISLGVTGTVGPLVVADFNADRKLDIVATVSGGAIVVLGNGDGSFQSPVHVADSSQRGFLLVGDFDGDNKEDVLVKFTRRPSTGCRQFCFTVTTGTLYLGNGDGTFQPGTQIVFIIGTSVLIATDDFNADHKLDLFVERGAIGLLRLGEGDGTSFLALPSILFAFGSAPSFITTSDLNGDNLPDLVLANGTDNTIAVVLNTSPKSGADLALTLDVQSPVIVAIGGGDLTYTATIISEGPQNASGVTLTDHLPSGLKFISAQPSQGTCSGTTTITCNLGAMTEPSSATVQFTVRPTVVGTFSDNVQVAATQSDLNSNNNTASVMVNAVLPADLAVSASASKNSGLIGDKVTVNVNVSNNGPGQATSVVLTDFVSDSTQVSGVTINTGSCAVTSGQISCQIGTLASGVGATMSYVVTLAASGFSDSLGVTADQPDLNPDNNNNNLAIGVSDFTLTAAAASLTIQRGQQGNDVLTITWLDNFSDPVTLSCAVTGPAPTPTCSVSPSSVTPNNTATLTVNAANLSASLTRFHYSQKLLPAVWFPLGILGCIFAVEKIRRRSWLICLVAMLAILLTACGDGRKAPQNYTVTVTAAAGTLQHSMTIAVTVQ